MRKIVKNYNVERINRQKIEAYLNKKNGLWSLVSKIAWLKAKNTNEIEDITSEALFRVWEKADTCRCSVDLNNPRFRAWVAVITENEVKQFKRKMNRFRDKHILFSNYCADETFPLEEFAAFNESPLSLAIQAEKKNVLETTLREVIPKLPYKLKTAIELHYFRDYTQSEIAKTLNIPFGTVQSRLYRARQVLRKKLEVYPSTVFHN